VGAHQIRLAQLFTDLSPDVMLGIVAAVEGGDAGRAEVEPFSQVVGKHRRAQMRMLGQQPEGHHQVGLAAAHGLGNLEDGLIRAPRKP